MFELITRAGLVQSLRALKTHRPGDIQLATKAKFILNSWDSAALDAGLQKEEEDGDACDQFEMINFITVLL